MNTNKLSRYTYMSLSILLLFMPVLTGCGKSETNVVELKTTDVGVEGTQVNEVGAGEIATSEVGIIPTPTPEIPTYTNHVYGFEFEYPKTWTLSEEDHEVVLMNSPNRLGIRFRWKDEQIGPDRTGLSAGDLIYEDKLLFMDQVTMAEYLIFEKKYKAVFYGGTSWIEIDDLLFWIELADLETGDYREIDLSEELLTEAKSIVESFRRIDRADDSDKGPITAEKGLIANLEIPEILPVGENVNLKFVLKNSSDTPLYVLKWYTPLEGIGGKIFRVNHEGRGIPYEGILANRRFPIPEDYVYLKPGGSVSAVVDLAKSFDFSETGEYTIKFLSPQISYIARTEDDMAKTMEELGPVNIPSNEISLELVGSPLGEGLPRLRTPEEAQEIIEAFLRDQNLDLGIEPILPVEELHTEKLWSALKAQVFKVSEWKFQNESFLIWGSNVFQLGTAMGGQGLTSMVVADIDQNHHPELFYAYSYGSEEPRSRIGMFSTAYENDLIFEANVGYLGQLRVFSDDWNSVGVQAIEGDQGSQDSQEQNTIGYLYIEQNDGNTELGLKIFNVPPDDILEKLYSTQDGSQE